jgi:hypothetical protein
LASDESFRNKHASEIKDRTKPEYGDKRLTEALAATIEREWRDIKRVLKFEVNPDRFNVVQRRFFSVWPIITRDEQPWRQRVADYRQRYKAGRVSGM